MTAHSILPPSPRLLLPQHRHRSPRLRARPPAAGRRSRSGSRRADRRRGARRRLRASSSRAPRWATISRAVSVPATVAVVLAVAYPRPRPGFRGVAALVCAALAIVAGIVEGLRHMTIDRLAGDDVTALLALGAGIVLAVVGASVLWCSRRLDERPARRDRRRALLAVAALAGLRTAPSCPSPWPWSSTTRRRAGAPGRPRTPR